MTQDAVSRRKPPFLEIRRPDDFHLHLRDGDMLQAVLPATAQNFARALVMPNLVPPVTTVGAARLYRRRILDALPSGHDFEPLMTLYLTETTSQDEIRKAAESGFIHAVKLYPAGATTNSASGVRDMAKARPVFDAMEAAGIPLCVHGEAADSEIDIFDREEVFIDRALQPLRRWNVGLRIVFEHVTTSTALQFVRDEQPDMAATITVHHLVLNRSRLFEGGLRPHRFCFPVAKREGHRRALVQAATGGEACFFLGTDSAPHPDRAKLNPCGCAGIYSAPIALPCLAQVFEDCGALGALEGFACEFGAKFYRLPLNANTCTLRRLSKPLLIPNGPAVGDDRIEVFDPGFPLCWEVN